jgi:hypothetical protein
MTMRVPWVLIAGLLVSFGGCSKSQPAPDTPEQGSQGASVDHIVGSKPQPPNNFLHQTFTVGTAERFEFTIPANIVRPVLRGSFVSFAKNKAGDLLSNENANVDLLLLTDQEFVDFSHGKQGGATYTVDPSHNQTVTYSVHSTVEQPQNYHLFFRNSPGGARNKLVKADFTISFE